MAGSFASMGDGGDGDGDECIIFELDTLWVPPLEKGGLLRRW